MKRLRFIAIVVAIILVGWLVFRPSGPQEPSYQGRTFTQWLIDYNRATPRHKNIPNREATTQAAEHAIKEIGTNVIPVLLQWLRVTNSPTKIRLNSFLDEQTFLRFRFETDAHRQAMASLGFMLLGNDALPAVPDLIRLLQSQNQMQQTWTIGILSDIDGGKKVLLPEFLQLLQDPNPDIHFKAALYLIDRYPDDEVVKAGVYKIFPDSAPPTKTAVETNSPPPNK